MEIAVSLSGLLRREWDRRGRRSDLCSWGGAMKLAADVAGALVRERIGTGEPVSQAKSGIAPE